MGLSSPSKQTFNILTASFTAGEQVPEESLQLSASFNNSSMDYAHHAPHSPQSSQQQQQYGGRRGGAPTPKAGVSFSLELPESTFLRADSTSPRGAKHSTPQRSGGDPGTPGSMALSEYSYLHDDDIAPGAAYISSPGHSAGDRSLSRSLSASFGQVSGSLPEDTADAKQRRGAGAGGGGGASPGRSTRAEGKGTTPRSPARAGKRYPYDSSPRSAGGQPPGGAPAGGLSPALLAQFSRAAQRDSDEDSVEGLEIPYGGPLTPSSKAAGASSIKGFRIHGTAKAAQIAQQAAVAVGDAMGLVEKRFRADKCTVGPFMASALAADVRNFDKVRHSLSCVVKNLSKLSTQLQHSVCV